MWFAYDKIISISQKRKGKTSKETQTLSFNIPNNETDVKKSNWVDKIELILLGSILK